MSLRIQLPPLAEITADTRYDWQLIDDRRQVVAQGTGALTELPRGEACEWVLAAPDVLLTEMALPDFTPAKLHLALPGLMEHTLLGEADGAFLVAGIRDRDGKACVAAVDRALLRRALDAFTAAGLTVRSAQPEPLALAQTPGSWRIRLGTRHGCVRTGPHGGFVLSPTDPATPPAELILALGQAGDQRPQMLEVEGPADIAAWQATLQGLPVRQVSSEGAVAPAVAFELLRHEFSPSLGDWKIWRPAIIAGGALLLIGLLGLNLHTWMLHQESKQLRREQQELFRGSFPAVQTLLDPPAQMRRAVQGLRGAGGAAGDLDFFGLANATAALLGSGEPVPAMEYVNTALRVELPPARAADKSWQAELAKTATQAGLSIEVKGSTLLVRRKAAR